MKVIVIGASTNPDRYSYMAVSSLKQHNHEVIPVGVKKGDIEGIVIQQGMPDIKDVHTVTLYINKTIQQDYYDYIINTIKPKRIIFNPGTENEELVKMAENKGINTLYACTLVMLSTNQF